MSRDDEKTTEAPFGVHKRDRWLAGRAMLWAVGVGTCVAQAVVLYAAGAYVEAKTATHVEAKLAPIVQRTAEELEARLRKTEYEADVRFNEARLAEAAKRVGALELSSDSLRVALEKFKEEQRAANFELKLMVREGFARQGVQLTNGGRE